MKDLADRICLMIVTDGRYGVLERTLDSFFRMAEFIPAKGLMIDDSGDIRYAEYLESLRPKLGGIAIYHHRSRIGFCETVAHGWSLVGEDAGYIFHLEDDFEFIEPVPLTEMVMILESDPKLAQIALVRQAWNDEEKAAGGLLNLHRRCLQPQETNGRKWFLHHRCFTTNPSLYPRHITEKGWPSGPYCEGKFGIKVSQMGYYFGYLAPQNGINSVVHIGEKRIGAGY